MKEDVGFYIVLDGVNYAPLAHRESESCARPKKSHTTTAV